MVSTNNGGGLSAADAASTDHERQVVDKWINKMRSEEV